MDEQHEYLKVPEVGKVLRIARSRAYELVAEGEIPSVRIGRSVRVSRRELEHWLEEKRARRARDEARKPLAEYRDEELARSRECFFGSDRSYHEARARFVYKLGAPCAVTPPVPATAVAPLAATGRSS